MPSEVKPIFLLSLPRSGSTLLQRIIACHPQVSTKSEPWVLLPFFYPLMRSGVYAEYSHSSTYTAVQEFLLSLKNGVDDYYSAVRAAAMMLYGSASSPGAKYFLDKSPRYSLISDHIAKAFPDAKFIFLWRNPLSMVASINETWATGKWGYHRYKVDLYAGMEKLYATYMSMRHRSLTIQYEALVADPSQIIGQLSTYLNLPFAGNVAQEFTAVKLNGSMGDPVGVLEYSHLSAEPLTKWKTTINSAYRRYTSRRYLEWLGRERLANIGYDLDKLLEDLGGGPPNYLGAIRDAAWHCAGNVKALFEFSLIKSKARSMRQGRTMYGHD